LARRATERARIDAARAQRTTAQGWRQTMVRPAPGRFSGRFGAQRIYRGQPGAYHGGLDMASPTGTLFVAPADGVVVLAAEAPFTLEGRLLMLDHGMGLGSAFLHCSSHLVGMGEAVSRGQPLGTVGMTGRATGPHLHWALAWQMGTVMRRLDPLLFLG
ncbi:M23 family metallopeptidase, partial [Novosphingobium sp. B-7]|uniref:M23 family metallopeptidase n=1 Tax=Novosphingobium sp. B-7 TaxID=1298855 RepID=UPI0003B707C8